MAPRVRAESRAPKRYWLTSSSPRGKITTRSSLSVSVFLSVSDSQRRFVTEFPLESLINTFALATIASARVVPLARTRYALKWISRYTNTITLRRACRFRVVSAVRQLIRTLNTKITRLVLDIYVDVFPSKSTIRTNVIPSASSSVSVRTFLRDFPFSIAYSNTKWKKKMSNVYRYTGKIRSWTNQKSNSPRAHYTRYRSKW